MYAHKINKKVDQSNDLCSTAGAGIYMSKTNTPITHYSVAVSVVIVLSGLCFSLYVIVFLYSLHVICSQAVLAGKDLIMRFHE